jgi:hypothetical protein
VSKSYEIRERIHNGANYETANSWDVELKAGETPAMAFEREIASPTVQRDCAGSKLVMIETDQDGDTAEVAERVI